MFSMTMTLLFDLTLEVSGLICLPFILFYLVLFFNRISFCSIFRSLPFKQKIPQTRRNPKHLQFHSWMMMMMMMMMVVVTFLVLVRDQERVI